MPLGSPLLTALHVLISLVGIGSGFVVIWGLIKAQPLDRWTSVFLSTTVATSVTGLIFFPYRGVTPGIVLAIISLVVLAVAIAARYPKRLAGPWRGVYAGTAVIAQYLNVFVLIVQSFQKLPVLHTLAPTQTEAPFAVVQVVVLLGFVAAAVASVARFRIPVVSET